MNARFSKFVASIALTVAFSGGIAAAQELKTGESDSTCAAMSIGREKSALDQAIALSQGSEIKKPVIGAQ